MQSGEGRSDAIPLCDLGPGRPVPDEVAYQPSRTGWGHFCKACRTYTASAMIALIQIKSAQIETPTMGSVPIREQEGIPSAPY